MGYMSYFMELKYTNGVQRWNSIMKNFNGIHRWNSIMAFTKMTTDIDNSKMSEENSEKGSYHNFRGVYFLAVFLQNW